MTSLDDAWSKAKLASIAGLGYFALTNPQGTARAVVRIAGATLGEQVRTWKSVTKIVGEELVVPEVARQRARGFPATGTLWSVSPWIPFVLFGGVIIQAIENVRCTLSDSTVFGCEPEGTGGLLNER